MREMQGPVSIFASQKIGEIYDCLCTSTRVFASQVIKRLALLALESTAKPDSSNVFARDLFSKFDITSPPTPEDIQLIFDDFLRKLRQMLEIMREELGSGSLSQSTR